MDFGALLKDKKTLAVVGVGGVAGLVILLRKGKGGTPDSGATDGGTPGVNYSGLPASGSIGGSYDSTSADIASQLSNYGQQQRDALSEFASSQLKATTDAIKALPVGPQLPKGAMVLNPNQGGVYRTNPKNTTLAQLAGQYHLTAPQFRQLNPTYAHFGAGSILPVGQVVRVG